MAAFAVDCLWRGTLVYIETKFMRLTGVVGMANAVFSAKFS